MTSYEHVLKMIEELIAEALTQHCESKNSHVRALALARAGAWKALEQWMRTELKLRGKVLDRDFRLILQRLDKLEYQKMTDLEVVNSKLNEIKKGD